MMNSRKSKTLSMITKLCICMTLSIFLTACSAITSPFKSNCKPSQPRLEQRIQKLWEAKTSDRWGDAYEMTSKKFQSNNQRKNFGKKSNVIVDSFQIKEIKINSLEPNKAKAIVIFKVNHMGISFPFEDKSQWVYENCDWYLE